GDGRAAVEAVERALAAGGAEPEVLERAARLCDALGEIDRSLALFGELMRLEPSRPRWVLNSARVLQRAGRTTEAELILETLYRNDVPPDAALRRPLIQDDPKRELQIVRGSSDTAVLVFMGLADQLVMPIPMFDRYLAEHDFTAVYLRDHQRLLYLTGMPSLAPDYAGTLAKLRGMLDALGVRRLITVGNSAGGVGAISYGIDMGAEQIIGFGSPTTLIGKLKSVDHRARAFADRLYRSVPHEQRDIEAKLRDPARKARVDLFYGEGMPEDRAHATQVEGVHGVTLRPLAGFGGHGSLLRLAQEGRLRAELGQLFAKR
ncbi:hypothetical protein, partial [Caulobacter sp. 17J65-9]|uniref:hypothetical protein n=1 Tax=Caulobacter sp. 17J65-9 TaxID=2709382 RepID=UPI0013CA74DD